MSEPVEIPILGLENIEEAMQYLRSAEVALVEFEKQTRKHFTLLGPRVSFINRELAEHHATLFEGYVRRCESVHGSHAWMRLVSYSKACLPRLDEFLAEPCEKSAVNLMPVLKDRKLRLEELRSYYAKERCRLIRSREFEFQISIEADLSNQFRD